jgi:hypothetical protein
MDHFDAQLRPGQPGGIAFREYPDAVSVDDEISAFNTHVPGESPVRRIVLREMSIGCGIGEIIDRYDLELIGTSRLINGAHDIAANASVSVDCYFYCHVLTPDFVKKRLLPANRGQPG